MNYPLTQGKFPNSCTCTVHIIYKHALFIPIRVVSHCRQCRELDNKARAREDYTLYRAMLKTIRQTEEEYKDDSHVIFLLQVRNESLLYIVIHVCILCTHYNY